MKFQIIYKTIILMGIVLLFPCQLVWADQSKGIWNLSLIYETERLTNAPFSLMASGDLNQNGIKEVTAAQFRNRDSCLYRQESGPDLFVLEWREKTLELQFKKQWRTEKTVEKFNACRVRRLVSWKIGSETIIETVPSYISLGWSNGKYILQEQKSYPHSKSWIGSRALPWLSSHCYGGPSAHGYRECLLGVRKFYPKESPRIITVIEEDNVIKNRKSIQRIRVRKLEPGFPIVYEGKSPYPLRWWVRDPIDWLNSEATSGLIVKKISPLERTTYSRVLVYPGGDGKELYRMKLIYERDDNDREPVMGLEIHEGKIGKTRDKDSEEYWGYTFKSGSDGGSNTMLRMATVNSKQNGFVYEDLEFPHHELFIGVGFFELKDLDGDRLDEIILVEKTGVRTFGLESVHHENVKDYIHILKWEGKRYTPVWVSPPIKEQGTKFIVDDVMNRGSNQLIVGTSRGSIQIWEKR